MQTKPSPVSSDAQPSSRGYHYGALMALALRCLDLSDCAIRVLCLMVEGTDSRLGDEYLTCRRSMLFLAANLGKSERTIQRAVREIEGHGIFTRISTGRNIGSNTTNVWRLNLDRLKTLAEQGGSSSWKQAQSANGVPAPKAFKFTEDLLFFGRSLGLPDIVISTAYNGFGEEMADKAAQFGDWGLAFRAYLKDLAKGQRKAPEQLVAQPQRRREPRPVKRSKPVAVVKPRVAVVDEEPVPTPRSLPSPHVDKPAPKVEVVTRESIQPDSLGAEDVDERRNRIGTVVSQDRRRSHREVVQAHVPLVRAQVPRDTGSLAHRATCQEVARSVRVGRQEAVGSIEESSSCSYHGGIENQSEIAIFALAKSIQDGIAVLQRFAPLAPLAPPVARDSAHVQSSGVRPIAAFVPCDVDWSDVERMAEPVTERFDLTG